LARVPGEHLDLVIQFRRPVAVVSPEPLTRRTMPCENQDHTGKILGDQVESQMHAPQSGIRHSGIPSSCPP
jgi:hypothetical protein